MNNQEKNLLKDTPINKRQEDLFDIDKYANALSEFINNSATPLTISIQGEWGSGKTSLMNLIYNHLCEKSPEQYEAIWINTWELFVHGEEKDCIEKFTLALIQEIIKKTDISKLQKEVKTLMYNVKNFVSKGFDFFASLNGVDNEVIKDFKSSLSKDNSMLAVKQIRNSMNELVNKNILADSSKKGLIFFIDDLDRIDPEILVKILEILKNLFDLERCIFILAVDHEMIIKGLERKYSKYESNGTFNFKDYFDKLIQLPFVMPVKRYKIEKILFDSLYNIGYFQRNEISYKNSSLLSECIYLSIGSNPRRIKRLVNAVRLGTLFDEINDKILSTYNNKALHIILVCIQLEYPSIYNILSKFPDYINWNNKILAEFIFDFKFENYVDSKISLDAEWKKILYKLCLNNNDLSKNVFKICRLFEIIDGLIEHQDGLIINRILLLSAQTNINNSMVLFDGNDYNSNSFTQFKQGSELINLVNCKEDFKVLDIGCGNGLTTIELYKKFPSITIDAFDISHSQIEIANKNLASRGIDKNKINFYQMDALELYCLEKYDLVFSNATLHWILDYKKMYKKIYNCLKQNGIITVHQGGVNSYAGLHNIVKLAYKSLNLENYFIDWVFPVFYPSKEEMEVLLANIGFSYVNVESHIDDGSQYPNLVDDFAKASLIPYMNRIPKHHHDALENKYKELCRTVEVDRRYHRLFIRAVKE